MQRIRDKQEKYKAGRKTTDESSETDTAGMIEGGDLSCSAGRNIVISHETMQRVSQMPQTPQTLH